MAQSPFLAFITSFISGSSKGWLNFQRIVVIDANYRVCIACYCLYETFRLNSTEIDFKHWAIMKPPENSLRQLSGANPNANSSNRVPALLLGQPVAGSPRLLLNVARLCNGLCRGSLQVVAWANSPELGYSTLKILVSPLGPIVGSVTCSPGGIKGEGFFHSTNRAIKFIVAYWDHTGVIAISSSLCTKRSIGCSVCAQ